MNASVSLADLLNAARLNRWCTRARCTTCGAILFGRALQQLIETKGAIAVTQQLAEIPNPDVEALDLVLVIMASHQPQVLLQNALEGSVAGHHYSAMLRARDETNERRRAYAATQTPEFIAANRTEKKRLKAEAHAARVAAKAVRDAEGRARREEDKYDPDH